MVQRIAAQDGVSLVEMLVGIAVGLVVVALCSLVAVGHFDDNRRLLLETQLQQDLRAAAEVLARDLRRSGYWGDAGAGIWSDGATAVMANPYTGVDGVVANGAAASTVKVSYSLDADHDLPENHVVDPHDREGFRLHDGALELQLGDGSWQKFTDPATLRITALQVELLGQTLSLADGCLRPCGAACPTQLLRQFRLSLQGAAVHDASVQRQLQTLVRVPNDVVSGACPP